MIKKILKWVNRETVTYLIFGVLTTIVGFGTYWLFSKAGFTAAASNTFSSAIAITFAYFTNKKFVFKSDSWKALALIKEFIAFCVGRLATFLLETGILLLFVDLLKFPNLPCKCATMVLVVIGNYVISKFAVFKKNRTE